MKMLIRAILPDWAKEQNPDLPKVLEGVYDQETILELNEQMYNIYYLPNGPSHYNGSSVVDGSQVDTFNYCFVDMDLKEGKYDSKEAFTNVLTSSSIPPSRIVDSGNGIHAYWRVSDLLGEGFLRLNRRLLRRFDTDQTIAKIYQLMRYPNTINTKNPDDLKLCEVISENDRIYTSEELDKALPPISKEDEAYCQNHYNKTYALEEDTKVSDALPKKFGQFLRDSKEASDIWKGAGDDRSKNDFRLGHLMFAYGFTKDEAMSVLINSAKALPRAPKHRITYAENIVDKIWTYELGGTNEADLEDNLLDLSFSVKDILEKKEELNDSLVGNRFSCYKWLDNTEHGFRLGQVMGLVGGSGVGKTAVTLNMFMGFVENNPDFDHMIIPLEQPAKEIAANWKIMCGTKTHLYDRVHIMDNYNADGSFRHLSLDDIKAYIVKFQKVKKVKLGCVVIDHIGALKKKGKLGENQDLMDLCHSMKPFALETQTFLIMQSQAPREKAGIGDLELNKDAAYGTVFFESYCDYLVSLWQPLKRCYSNDQCPTVTAIKFCKIRHKNTKVDRIQEDVRYTLFFDSITKRMREMTQDEETSFDFFNKNATNLRKQDRKTDVLSYTSVRLVENKDGATHSNQNPGRTTGPIAVLKRQGPSHL